MKSMIAAILKKVGINKGAPRVYIEGVAPARAGFHPGVRYSLEKHEGRQAVVLRVLESGDRIVSRKEKKNGEAHPVIDINSMEALAAFEGMEQVRVLVGNGEIWILPLAVEVKRKARNERLLGELAEGRITTAEVAHGLGVMANALHKGLASAGIKPSLRWAIEIEEDALDLAQRTNDAWNSETVAVAMPLQDIAFADDFVRSRLEPVSMLSGGLPCTAASLAGRSKKKLAMPEDDEKAGHLVAAFIALVARVNPALVTLENVGPYFNTASASILRTQLRELGYSVDEVTLDGADFAIETRVRKVMVAVSRGIELDVGVFASLPRPEKAFANVGEVLEDVPDDDPRWSEMNYLKEKEVRDKAAGKGFRMAIATPDVTGVGTLGRGFAKVRSTEPKVQHPRNPDLLRIFTPTEHARVKGIPEHLIEGVSSATRAHELLGQSVIWPAFRELGAFLGTALLAKARDDRADEGFALVSAAAA